MTMHDAVLATLIRGPVVESIHLGAAAVVDKDGKLVFSAGDIDRLMFPRSTAKIFQSLPLLTTGAAEKYGFSDRELALAIASHTGEAAHTETATAMLAAAGMTPSALECGVQWPTDFQTGRDIILAGQDASAMHNCCSGKHAGFVCVACAEHLDVSGYVRSDHPIMRRIAGIMEEVTGVAHTDANRGTDGCAIPTWAIPLRSLAHAYARLAAGTLPGDLAQAGARFREAASREAFMVAGTAQFDTLVMQETGLSVFSKMGAEGIMVAALPEQGLGIVVKCRDGGIRAAEAALAALIRRFGPARLKDHAIWDRYVAQKVTTRSGAVVGGVYASDAMLGAD